MTDTVEWLKEQGAPEVARHLELMEKYGHLPIMATLEKLEKLEMYVIQLKLAAWAVIDVEGGPEPIEPEDWEEKGPWQDLLTLLTKKDPG